jgi:hypothetical protein
MSHRPLCPLLALLLLVTLGTPAASQGEKARFKLGLLIGSKDDRRLDGDVLSAATEAFVSSRRFIMIERSQLDAVFTEKDLQEFLGKGNSALSDVLGLDLLGLVGYSSENSRLPGGASQPLFVIEVRLVDVKTGQILTTISSERPDLLRPPATPREAGRHLFQSVREAFPPFGFVIRVSGAEVVVDLGSEAGLQKGDILEVVREGEQIIHPVTGETLPSELIVIGTLKVVSTSPQLSTCRVKSGEASPQLGNPVRLKEQNSLLKRWIGKGREIIGG